jgi:cyanophycin synthetase
MKLLGIRTYDGCSIYSYHPVVTMLVDLEQFAELPSDKLEDFGVRLLGLLPGLYEHGCCLGRPGGFAERLQEGTYLGHVIEHVALELQCLVGTPVKFGKTRETDRPGTYNIVFSYQCKPAGIRAAQIAFELINALALGKQFDLERGLRELKQLTIKHSLGPSTEAIVKGALERGIPFLRLNDFSLIQLGYGCHQKRIQATVTGQTSCIAVDIACDKNLTKAILTDAGIPVPYGGVVDTEEEAWELAKQIGFPLVVKPCDGNQGKGVTLDLNSEKEVVSAFAIASTYSQRMIVEKYIPGKHYRILVVGDSVVAVSERIPAHVVGDGMRTIKQLIELENHNPNRGEGHEKPLTKIKIDPVVLMVLARQNLTLEYIPQAGEVIFLRDNANLSTGGSARDVTDFIHPYNYNLAIRVTKQIGLDVAGIDVVAEDISLPIKEGTGAIIEVNAAPGIRMHHHPVSGKPRDAAGAILDFLYPPGSQSRIPLVAITGTNGKTTTTRLISYILGLAGHRVGMTSSSGVFINGKPVLEGDATGAKSAQLVLKNPEVTVGVLETARGGLIRSGLAFDYCDVSIITNISEDHLGQDGIDSLEDLVFVKSLILERTMPKGHCILNADDKQVLKMAGRCRGQLLLFSTKDDNLIVRRHLGIGGRAVFIKEEVVIYAEGDQTVPLLNVKSIPLTMGGKAKHNLENTMAAIAAGLALQIDPQIIVRGVSEFKSNFDHNPGRLNLIQAGGVRVVIDYGHNIAGYEATLNYARQLNPSRLIGVIGVPGDRRNETIERVGLTAGEGFDYLVIKEDRDLRGRMPGEVAQILFRGAQGAGKTEGEMEIVLDEGKAVNTALSMACKGDVVVVFYEDLELIREVVYQYPREKFNTELTRPIPPFL